MISLEDLNEFFPVKKKFVQFNHYGFLYNKLCNIFLREETTEARLAYNKRRNACVRFLRKPRRLCFENLGIKNLKDNRKLKVTSPNFFLPYCSLQVKINELFYYRENCVSFSRYLDSCVFHESANFKIFDVIINIKLY